MKNLIIGLAVVALFSTGVAYGAGAISIKNKWGTVTTPSQTTEIYRVYDMENEVMCYFSYVKGSTSATPSVDCVKL